MSFFNEYPYRNITDLNLDWLIKAIRTLRHDVDDFVTMNAIKYADPIDWDITKQYEKNTVVIDANTGVAYLSVAPVPSGVNITRPEYWTVIFDLSRFLTAGVSNLANTYESQLTYNATVETTTGGWVMWNGTLYEALNDIHIGDRYVPDGNIRQTTVETFVSRVIASINAEIQNRIDSDTILQNNIDAEAQARQDADTTLQGNIVAEAQARQDADGTLQGNIDAEAQARQDADTTLQGHIDEEAQARQDADTTLQGNIDETNDHVGSLNDLATANKSNLVGAINEVAALSGSEIFTKRKFILIGDSYANGTNLDDPTHPLTGFYAHFVNFARIPAGNYYITAEDGYGFARPNMTFLSLLQAVAVPAPTEITDIVVCGGANDSPEAVYPGIENAIASFCNYCRTNYPNATVHIGMISHNFEGSNGNYNLNRVLSLYLKAAQENGANYINNIENVLHYTDCFNPDGHPSETGQRLLGRSLVNGLKTGFVTIWTQNQLQNTLTLDSIWNDTTVSTIFTTQHDNVVEILNNQFINLSLVTDIAVSNREYSDFIKIGHLSNTHIIGGAFNFTTFIAPVCLYLSAGTNTGAIAEYYIFDGDLYMRVYNTLKQNYTIHGVRICPFAATFPAKYC